jgi:aspartate racemase
MKKIGLIGGTTWQSTIDYYRIINETAVERQANGHAAKIVLESLDFGDIGDFMKTQDFAGLTAHVIRSAQSVEKAGAELLLLCANTLHFIADEVQASISIPLLHIIDVTAFAIWNKGLSKVALLGTEYTMEQEFYRERMKRHGIEILVPVKEDRTFLNGIIFSELFYGEKKPGTKNRLLAMITDIEQQGAQGVILGCTELPLILSQADCNIPVFDTTDIHARAAVEKALSTGL